MPSSSPTIDDCLAIALVEDETVLREELSFQLQHLGFAVEAFENASQLYRRLAVHKFDIVILDIGLPGEDGLSICNYLRQHDKQVGIVFVTARAQREDRLSGLHAGADAYLQKPIDIDELELLLKRLGERSPCASAVAPIHPGPSYAGWQLAFGADCLIAPSGLRVRMSSNEVRLLRLLLEKSGDVAVSSELAAALVLLPDEFHKHRVEVIVSRMREKVLRETGTNLPIKNKRGMGYSFGL